MAPKEAQQCRFSSDACFPVSLPEMPPGTHLVRFCQLGCAGCTLVGKPGVLPAALAVTKPTWFRAPPPFGVCGGLTGCV